MCTFINIAHFFHRKLTGQKVTGISLGIYCRSPQIWPWGPDLKPTKWWWGNLKCFGPQQPTDTLGNCRSLCQGYACAYGDSLCNDLLWKHFPRALTQNISSSLRVRKFCLSVATEHTLAYSALYRLLGFSKIAATDLSKPIRVTRL